MSAIHLEKGKKAIIIWLVIGIIMTIIQILLGGITRLTGSGLSITDWKPIMGAIPPMNEAAWNEAFEGYKKIGQYKTLNNHFDLANFKFIFFWEWLHRLWGRLIGIVFIVPFFVFWIKKYFTKELTWALVGLFLLGALQAVIGWIMVKSGLNPDDLYVNHIRLAIHFITAFLLLVYEVWFLMRLTIKDADRVAAVALKNWVGAVIILLIIQFAYGAFMAGLKAAPAAPTWPTINGSWLPDGMSDYSWINHPINVHFIHRGIAYLVFVWIVMMSLKWFKLSKSGQLSKVVSQFKYVPMVLVSVQVLLGILSVLNAHEIVHNQFGTYEWMAILHQTVAILLVSSLVVQYYLLLQKK